MRYAQGAIRQADREQVFEVPALSPLTHVVQLPKHRRRLSPLQKWGYGLLTAAFLIGGVQSIRCGITNGFKLEALLKQRAQIEKMHQAAIAKNDVLRDKISLYSSPFGIEEMARERLSMVEKDEILVRVYPVSVAKR